MTAIFRQNRLRGPRAISTKIQVFYFKVLPKCPQMVLRCHKNIVRQMKISTSEVRNFHRQHFRKFYDFSTKGNMLLPSLICKNIRNVSILSLVLKSWKFLKCCRWKFLESKLEIFISLRIFLWHHRTICGQFGSTLK